jgi:hypothetical protein
MNDEKLKKLFELARSEIAPAPPEGFDARVVHALRREAAASPVSLWDQLEALFPRMAVATVLLMGLCVLGDYSLAAVYPASFSAQMNEISEQWLFAANGD